MVLAPPDVFFGIVGGALLAIMTASPKRAIGPRDDRLGSRERWAYFSYTFLVGLVSYTVASVVIGAYGFFVLLLILPLLIVVPSFFQAGYYLFLTEEDNSPS